MLVRALARQVARKDHERALAARKLGENDARPDDQMSESVEAAYRALGFEMRGGQPVCLCHEELVDTLELEGKRMTVTILGRTTSARLMPGGALIEKSDQ